MIEPDADATGPEAEKPRFGGDDPGRAALPARATPGRALEIWVMTDGRAGNENPAKALAEGVAAAAAADGVYKGGRVRIKRLRLRPGLAWLTAGLWTALGAREGGWPFTGLVDRGASLSPPYPDLAIGAGRRSAPFVLAVKRLSGGGARGVQILDPKIDPRRFDLVVAPAHDGLSGPGVLTTVGSLHDVGPTSLAGLSDPRLAGLRGPLIGLLIGGPSGAAGFEVQDADRIIDALRPLAAAGAGIAATPSRRTPKAIAARLEAEIRGFGGFFWDGEGDNPYRAILAQADVLVATADSVNMASEAAGAGKPLFIAPISRLSPKLESFHQALLRGGYAQELPTRLDLRALAAAKPRRLDDRGAAVSRILEFFGRPPRSGPKFG